ncbi:hypothetical protein N7532_004257 [Penicillium argentinense]|uniref:Uncharacterized protein n=1 Tax=Penicillium argentinense TaxID=1131581 RepID=A0A9W9FP52_9EURO|nr:uncharacterized protein N7532_004257 [Penicillium argentinense]KAJ5103728.1 hypothetical protein N7532_004257 [Penicillium argentinense]
MMPADLPRFHSPKRKRETSEIDYYSPSASPTSTVSVASLQEARLREDLELGRHSPRAAVAGRFGQLAIRGERLPEPGPLNDSQQGRDATSAEESCAGHNYHDPKTMPEALPPSREISPPIEGHQAPPRGVSKPADDVPHTPMASPSRRTSTLSRKKTESASPSKSRKPRLSPPPAEVHLEDPFTWHDDEITGHNPSDPSDDGYGINGVGFKPTAAMAWARSQKRQKQVAEWRSREAREAREKRRERRNDGLNLDSLRGIHKGAIQKRVKFDV